MGSLKLDLLASFAGQGWSGLMNLAFIPVYVRYMGMEAYGLVGFYLTLQGLLQILDFGLGPTVKREMARCSTESDAIDEARTLLRTLEIGYWAVGLVIGGAMLASARLIAVHWIQVSQLPVSAVHHAVLLMAGLLVLKWPLTLYDSALIGLQRQKLLNGIQAAMATVSNAGSALALALVAPTILTFLVWQILSSIVRLAITAIVVWRCLANPSGVAQFSVDAVRRVWRFAAGMTGITLSGVVLIQLDRVILSRMLALESFGYYTLARMVGSGLSLLVAPVFNVAFPRLSALAAVGDREAIRLLYHRASQLVAVTTLPCATVLVVLPFPALEVWTGSAETARQAAPIVRLVVLGSALNSLMVLPYSLQLAYGWTTVGLALNGVLTGLLVPCLLILVPLYGPAGAAGTWALLNGIYIAIGAPLTHRRLLPGEASRWLVADVGLPLVTTLTVVLTGRLVMSMAGPMAPPVLAGMLALILLAAGVGALLASHELRPVALSQVARAMR